MRDADDAEVMKKTVFIKYKHLLNRPYPVASLIMQLITH